ncbi:MAG: hypothetical protein ACM3ML_00665 [Micromonosporaceae bacterium]
MPRSWGSCCGPACSRRRGSPRQLSGSCGRCCAQFAASYQAIATRRGKKIATTAAARKLLTRAWHLLTDAERAAAVQPAQAAAAARAGTR